VSRKQEFDINDWRDVTTLILSTLYFLYDNTEVEHHNKRVQIDVLPKLSRRKK
jgi:hypothetical protein